MVNTNCNVSMEHGNKYLYQKGNSHCRKASKPNISSAHFKIFHQNIRGLARKTDELISHLLPYAPHVLCLTEHHLRNEEICSTHIDSYTLGGNFCREKFRQGGVCIYVANDIQFNTINLNQHIREKDLEICAINIHLPSRRLTLICIYRSPSGNFNYFITELESVLNKLHKVSSDLIICGDFNINHLKDNSRKHHLEHLLASFNLSGIVKFPTRTFNNSSTLIDNFYINTTRHNYSVHPMTNGLSDHDAQIINLSLIATQYVNLRTS